jgi:hypothetical protein
MSIEKITQLTKKFQTKPSEIEEFFNDEQIQKRAQIAFIHIKSFFRYLAAVTVKLFTDAKKTFEKRLNINQKKTLLGKVRAFNKKVGTALEDKTEEGLYAASSKILKSLKITPTCDLKGNYELVNFYIGQTFVNA